jgi:NAD-reducing hydrogenase small subunit
MGRLRLATMWLGGCSGCHMSFLDLDEFLIDLIDRVDVVYSPLVDTKVYPENVDVALVEGAVCNEDNLALLRRIRAHTKFLIAFGDCAVTGNVSAIRNVLPHGAEAVLKRSYVENGDRNAQIPETESGIVPPLLEKVIPIHAVVPVDLFLPGCPPPADRIKAVVAGLLNNAPVTREGSMIRFG